MEDTKIYAIVSHFGGDSVEYKHFSTPLQAQEWIVLENKITKEEYRAMGYGPCPEFDIREITLSGEAELQKKRERLAATMLEPSYTPQDDEDAPPSGW